MWPKVTLGVKLMWDIPLTISSRDTRLKHKGFRGSYVRSAFHEPSVVRLLLAAVQELRGLLYLDDLSLHMCIRACVYT